jgi:hypothetical protein
MDTKVFSVATKVLLRISVGLHVSCTRCSSIPCGIAVSLLCLFIRIQKNVTIGSNLLKVKCASRSGVPSALQLISDRSYQDE